MRETRRLAAAVALVAACVSMTHCGAVTVTVDPNRQYQTIRGWGSAFGWIGMGVPPMVREAIIDECVNGLGTTRLRFESSGIKWERFNDDGDPNHINWNAFNTAAADERAMNLFVPFKQRVEANGEPFSLYVSPSFFDGGSSGSVPAWLLHSPGEYAEYATSILLYLKDRHGLTADYYSICNEAGNNNAFTPEVVGRMIKTLGPRLPALGLPTKIEFPECVNAQASWQYIQALQDDAEVWPHVGLISYHLYGDNSIRPSIRDFALARGLPTGQTEFMGLTINHLYDDLTLGGVSYWELYALDDVLRIPPSRTSFSRTPQYWQLRQVLHYVRPGAVRVEAASDDPALRPLAFVRNGQMSVVLLRTTPPWEARTATVQGLPPGPYGVCQSGSNGYQELGLQTVGEAGTLTVTVPSGAVLTLYPHPDANLPPTVTDWKAEPTYLTRPASRITLSASAVDPEQDPLSYAWSLARQPEGANAILAAPNAASTPATGLTVAGDYLFTVAVRDPAHMVTRQVLLTVFADNQAPEILDLHHRIPVMVTLPTRSTTLRGGGRDLEGDPLTYQWSVVSQPAGASVSLDTPTKPGCKASNMTVAGDYVFKFEVSDPTHTVAKELTVAVYPENAAPVIARAAATPATLTLPASSTQLSAKTSDPDGDVITHWWSVKSQPAGATPAFANPGAAETSVSGLTSAGTYVFTLTVVDRTRVANRDVTVTVGGG